MMKRLKYTVFVILFCITYQAHTQTPTAACSTGAGNQLTVGGACGSGTISDATIIDAPFPSCGADTRDGWFWFTATSTATTVTAISGNRQLLLEVLSGVCGGPYTEEACANSNTTAGAQTETATFPTTVGTTYFVRIVNQNNNNMNLSSVCVTNGTLANPCTSIVNIAACGTSVTANLSGAGASWNTTACGFTTPGAEQIYSFTPSTTGTYSINVSSVTGGYVDYFWINSTSGCSSSAAWNCIQDIGFTGNYGSMSWTAGQTYYILLNDENTTASSQTFSINCPGTSVTASECASAVNVCTNLSFAIDPNGFGTTNEIPALGSTGNPDYISLDGINSPWGTDHWGCLRSGETNSTWMLVNIATSGMLEFIFGGGGTQVGFYDWIMYPYSSTACAQIPTGSYAPVRCNWNEASSGGTGLVTTVPAGGTAGNYEPPLAVTAGQQYIICFSNWSSASTTVPLDFTGSTATVSCTPLPVSLTSFDGHKKDLDVLLNWKTMSEANVSHYTVLHSTDGYSYSSIGTVAAHEGNQENLYDFMHNNPFIGLNYYKLVLVDANNQSMESGVLVVDFSKDEIVVDNIYPNPATETIRVNINGVGETQVDIYITDVAGKVVSSQRMGLVKGKNTIEINTRLLAKGVYNFTVSNPAASLFRVQRLIIE